MAHSRDPRRAKWKSLYRDKQTGRDLEIAKVEGVPVLPLLGEREPTYDWKAALPPFLFPATGGLLFGYDTGATSGACLSLKSAVLSGTDWYKLNSLQIGIVESGSLYGALVGCILAFSVADYLGRRRELICAALFYLLGAIVTASAPGFTVLVVGRLIYGLGIGMTMHGAPMYISETSPPQIRGTLISMKETLIVSGILVGYLVSYMAVDAVGGWRIMFSIGAPFACCMGLGMWWLPPSPRWILLSASKGSGSMEALQNEAALAIHRLRGRDVDEHAVKAQLEETFQSLQSAFQEEERVSFLETFKGNSLKALFIGVGLVFFQQATGQPSVLYYAASIFQSAGFSAASDATGVSIFLGLFKVFMTLIAVWKVDQLGRRPLLITGVSGVVLSLFLLVVYYSLAKGPSALAIVSLLFYVGCYQVSFGPMSWLILSEIFPLRTRGRALSIAMLVNFAMNAFVTFSFSPMEEAVGEAVTFLTFGIIGMIALLFIVLKVPETRGLSLEEIEKKLWN